MIYRSLILIAFLSFTFSCKSGNQNNSKDAVAVMDIPEPGHSFGVLNPGDKAEYIFEFKNTGSKPLIINDVKSSCGCTVPKWSDEPIEPGKSGEVTVSYNTRIRGNFHKSVTVYSNAQNSPVVLKIKGIVSEEK